ncbi:hypothetical protein GCM10009830_21940 [Glycomyces endophyticus]|uniref:Polyhydroxybutyrate depolymerase n=1 Tax=Glycomyces endophyticus TaxID=480996 RepID=A0ABN2GQ81_9ACTN
MRPLTLAAAALACAALLGACAESPDEAADAAPSPEPVECETGEFTRVEHLPLGEHSYSMSFPCTEEPLAAVIALHGMPGSGAAVQTASGLDGLAESEGFIAVYPSDPEQQWDAAASGADTDFLGALVDELVAARGADPDRIYLAGFSNGGDMAVAAAVGLGDRIAGAAAVVPSGTGGVLGSVATVATPVPLIAFIGESDPRVAGASALATWRDESGCAASGTDAGEGWSSETWACEGGVPMVEYLVDGGHEWFGSERAPVPLWASRTMWEFFTGLG